MAAALRLLNVSRKESICRSICDGYEKLIVLWRRRLILAPAVRGRPLPAPLPRPPPRPHPPQAKAPRPHIPARTPADVPLVPGGERKVSLGKQKGFVRF